jgi:hypothetical protein
MTWVELSDLTWTPPAQGQLDDSHIAAAARRYVEARVELAGADLGSMLPACVTVDVAWADLLVACGFDAYDDSGAAR